MVATPKLLGGNGSQGKPQLQIIPDNNVVLLQGRPSEAPPATLTGKLLLDTPDSINVKTIKIKLEGIRKISYAIDKNKANKTSRMARWMNNAVNPQLIQEKKVFLRDERMLYPADGNKSKPHKLGAGHKEWNFEFSLSGDLPESVEGLAGSYIVYNLSAVVSTASFMTKDIVAKSHIRLVRTLSLDVLDMVPMEQINEDVWRNKISYKISTPRTNYIFGTSVTSTFTLTPIRKGVQIQKITMEVEERCVFTVPNGDNTQSHEFVQTVAELKQKVPENARQDVAELDPSNPLDESYHFQMTIPLPRSLKRCRQSVDTDQIRITHQLKIYVNLLNPESHVSQLVVKNLLHLYISPNYQIGEDLGVNIDANQQIQEAINEESNQAAPPGYGQHHFDQLWSGIDPSGFMTPGPRSGISTPFYSQSRNTSAENLASLDAMAQDPASHGGLAASALHSRLTTLQDREGRLLGPYANHSPPEGSTPHEQADASIHWSVHTPTPPNGSHNHSGSSSRQSRSGAPSRRTSDEQHQRSTGTLAAPSLPATGPMRLGYDMDSLSRIPSYNTAVRTPVATTPQAEGLPSYEAATSRPPSPVPPRTVLGRGSSENGSTHGAPIEEVESNTALRDATERNTAANAGVQYPAVVHARR